MTEYIKLFWEDAPEGEPPVILYEVDTDHERLALRSIDIFADGCTRNISDLYVGAIEITPIPTVEEFNAHVWGEEFRACLIEKAEFEAVWESRTYDRALKESGGMMEQADIYTEALTCLRLILQTDHPEFKNWIDWLERDIEDWTQRREVAHHLRAYGGMGSFNDLPNMRGSHNYIFGFLKSVCYAFGHLYGKREGISPAALMEECVHDAEKASYHPHKGLNRAIAWHLLQGDLQENLDTL